MAVLQCIPPLCELLTVQDARVINVGLEGLANILNQGEKDKENAKETAAAARAARHGLLHQHAGALLQIRNEILLATRHGSC